MRRYQNVSIIVNDLNHDKIQENVKYDKSQKEQFKEFEACLAKWVLVPITQIVASARAPGRSAEHVSEFPVTPKISYI